MSSTASNMRPTRDLALRAGIYLTAAISGLAAAYVLREWIHRLWDPNGEKPPSVTEQRLSTDEDTHTPSTSQTRSLPPLRIPPRSDTQASSMTTQTAPASLNGDDGVEEEDVAQSDTLVDVMSPHPPRVISKQRSMRAHDLFAESHISFSELGSFVAPQDEPK